MTDAYIIRVISALFIFGIFLLGRIIWYGTKYFNQEYVEPKYKNHKVNKKKYRQYLINCDKKGKVPLSYRQWKFAYQKTGD